MADQLRERPYDVLVIADTCVDLILRDDEIAPQFGQTEKIVAAYDMEMGGSCCIFAAQAAKLGLKVALLGKVGDDAFGELVVNALTGAGVDTRFVSIDPRLKTGVTVHLVQGDDRAMLTHPGSLAGLTGEDVTDEMLKQARHMHYGSLFLQTGLLPDWIGILRRAKRLGLTVSLDTNWDPDERWDCGFQQALPYVDVLLPNEQEAQCLSGARDLRGASDRLRRRVPLLVVKRAAEGALAFCKEVEYAQSVQPAEAGGDGIGAGDSFAAGFLAGWLKGLPPQTCLEIACYCGRAVAGAVGGLSGQPAASQIDALNAETRQTL